MPEYDARDVDAAAGPGATAVLHGMLSTLTEVLDGLDRRLAGLEGLVAQVRLDPLAERVARLEELLDARWAEIAGGRDRTAEALAAIGTGVSHVAARLDQLAEVEDEPEPEPEPAPEPEPEPEPDRIGPLTDTVARVERAVEGLARRIDALPAPVEPEPVDLRPVLERLQELAVSVDTVSFGLAGLTDELRAEAEEPDVVGAVTHEAERIRAAVAALGEAVGTLAERPTEVNVDVDLGRIVALLEEHGAAVRDEVARLDTLLRGQAAEVVGRTGSITEVIGRLDGRLHEVVDGVRALQRRSADEPVRLTVLGGE